MPETTSTEIEIPSMIASSIHLTGIPIAPLKLLLIAESERPRDSTVADMPINRVRAMAGWTARAMHESIERLAPLRTRWCEAPTAGGEVLAVGNLTFEPFAAPPRARFDGSDERVVVRFTRDWCVAARDQPVVLPLDELRAYTRRSALLLRLRAGAALLDADKARLRIAAADLGLLSGCPEGTNPAAHLSPHIGGGEAELAATSSTVACKLTILSRKSGHVRGVDLAMSRIHQRSLRGARRPKVVGPVEGVAPG